MDFLKDKKNLVILLLSILFAIKIPREDLRFTFWVFGGILLTSLFDIFAIIVLRKRKIIPKSAVISGFIVSGILDYHQSWLMLVIFSLLPILSKHLLKFKHKHIFNPANFSLAIATLFKISLTWNIESNIYLVIIVGLYIAYSLKKIPHLIGFFVCFIGLFLTQTANPFSLVSWFFVFIMLIEPKTSGLDWWRGLVYGSIGGISSFLIFKFFPGYDFLIGALCIANICNPMLDKIKKSLTREQATFKQD